MLSNEIMEAQNDLIEKQREMIANLELRLRLTQQTRDSAIEALNLESSARRKVEKKVRKLKRELRRREKRS